MASIVVALIGGTALVVKEVRDHRREEKLQMLEMGYPELGEGASRAAKREQKKQFKQHRKLLQKHGKAVELEVPPVYEAAASQPRPSTEEVHEDAPAYSPRKLA